MRILMITLAAVFFAAPALAIADGGNALATDSPLRVGWVVGDTNVGPSILHTRNGGRKWVEQADISKWFGYSANDVSAVDKLTAWVAMGASTFEPGVILHTTNGGTTWTEQTLPDGVDSIKQIKGLSRIEAWAASLNGTILHTTDGGETWNIVESEPYISQVNRMDVIGCSAPQSAVGPDTNEVMSNANIWIVDNVIGNYGMVHSLYNGELWRQEYIPSLKNYNPLVHMVAAYSPRVVWAAAWSDGTLYRTLNGGETWEAAAVISGPNDFDDMCSPSPDTLWTVQNLGGNSGGIIFHARIPVDGSTKVVKHFNPAPGYVYAGLTCLDDQTALVVGKKGVTLDSSYPEGVIVSTTDGGDNWTRHSAPLDDVWPWKTSFVGARR